MVDEQPPNNHDPEPNEHPDAASSGIGEGQAKPTEQTPTTKESEHPKEKAYLTLWFERIKAMFQRQWNKTRLSEFKAVEDWTLAVALVGLVLAAITLRVFKQQLTEMQTQTDRMISQSEVENARASHDVVQTRAQLKITQQQAQAAEDLATAARNQSTNLASLVATERGIASQSGLNEPHLSRRPEVKIWFNSSLTRLMFRVVVFNDGKAEATEIRIAERAEFRGSEPPNKERVFRPIDFKRPDFDSLTIFDEKNNWVVARLFPQITIPRPRVGRLYIWGSARYKDRLGNQIAPPLRFCGYMDQNFVDNAARSPSGFPAVSTSNPAGDGPEGYAADYSGECENQ